MADVIMPEEIIKDTYGEIPDELINVEKLLERLACPAADRRWQSAEKDQSAAARST